MSPKRILSTLALAGALAAGGAAVPAAAQGPAATEPPPEVPAHARRAHRRGDDARAASRRARRLERTSPDARRADGPPAHRRHAPGARMERRLQRMAHALSLTPSQTARIRAVFERSRGAAAERVRTLPARSPERHAARRALRQETMARVLPILTPAQRVRLEALKAERRERRAERAGERPNGRRARRDPSAD